MVFSNLTAVGFEEVLSSLGALHLDGLASGLFPTFSWKNIGRDIEGGHSCS